MSENVLQIVKHELDNALSIADLRGDIRVVKSELDGVREQQKAHHQSTQESFKKMDVRFASLDTKIDTILENVNKGKGGISSILGLITAGAAGAAILKALSFMFSKIS